MTEKQESTGLKGELPLGYSSQAVQRTLVATFVVFGSICAMWLIAFNQVFDMQWETFHPRNVGKAVGYGVLLGLAGAVGVRLMLFLRQPRGAKLTWDESGITEWDGKDRRVFIPRELARYNAVVINVKSEKGQDLGRSAGHFQIADDQGNLIEVSSASQPYRMNGRRNNGTFDVLVPFLTGLPKMPQVLFTGASTGLMMFTALAAYVCLWLGLMMFCQPHGISESSTMIGAILILAGGGLFFLRSLWPLMTALKTRSTEETRRSAGAWRRAHLLEFLLRLGMTGLLVLPALKILGIGQQPAAWSVVKPGYSSSLSCAIGPNDSRLQKAAPKLVWHYNEPAPGTREVTLGAARLTDAMALDPRGRYAAYEGSDNSLQVWDGQTGQLHPAEKTHEKRIRQIVFSPDGSRIAMAVEDKIVEIWDPVGPRLVHNLAGHKTAALSVAFSADGRRLASGGWDELIIWDAGNGQKLHTVTDVFESIRAVDFSPDGKLVAAGQNQGELYLIDAGNGVKLRDLDPHKQGVEAVRFHPSGRHLLSASQDQAIYIWDVEAADLVQKINLRTDKSFRQAFDSAKDILVSPDGGTFRAVTSFCAVIKGEFPPEVSGSKKEF